MSDLYTTPDLTKAIEAGKKAFEYGRDLGPTDIHTVDAGLTALSQINVLTRKHEHGPTPVFATACPEECDSADDCCAKGLELLDECESQIPKGASDEAAAIDPNTIMLLLQVAALLKKLFGF